MYGVGLRGHDRILVALDGKTALEQIVGVIPKHLYLLGSVSSIDTKGGRLFVVMDGCLVSVSLAKASLISDPRFCEPALDCPLSFGWYNG